MIKVLVGPPAELGFAGVSHVTGDFTWTEPGELVFDIGWPREAPGCDRALIGARSRKGTTRAVVVKMDISESRLLEVSEESMVQAWGDSPAMRKCGRDGAAWTLREAAKFEVGSIVGKDRGGSGALVAASAVSVGESYEQLFGAITEQGGS